ncbi:HTH-type transcriptional regulator LysM [Stetteria hydrogenophila]
MARRQGLDERDYKLLELLRRNARASYASLARSLGLTESAVRKRIARLVKLGVIRRFTIDYEVEGEISALILVKTSPPSKTPDVAAAILENQAVERVYEVTGEYDIVAVARARGAQEVNAIIDYIRSIPGVASTYTMIVLRAH